MKFNSLVQLVDAIYASSWPMPYIIACSQCVTFYRSQVYLCVNILL